MEAMAATIGKITAPVNGFLTGRSNIDERSFYRSMLTELVTRIEQRLEALEMKAAVASRQAGLSDDAIRNIQRAARSGKREGVSTRTIAALAKVLKTTEAWLMSGEGGEDVGGGAALSIHVTGQVGATPDGQVVMLTGKDRDEVPPPPGPYREAMAFEVNGPMLQPVGELGAVLYFGAREPELRAEMIGDVCAVETDDGRVLVAKVRRGAEPGRYDLEPVLAPTIPNVRLKWAAEFLNAMRPAQAARSITRAKRSAA